MFKNSPCDFAGAFVFNAVAGKKGIGVNGQRI
jgi:hypothetical protein